MEEAVAGAYAVGGVVGQTVVTAAADAGQGVVSVVRTVGRADAGAGRAVGVVPLTALG